MTIARDLMGSVCHGRRRINETKKSTTTNHDDDVEREKDVVLRGWRMGAITSRKLCKSYIFNNLTLFLCVNWILYSGQYT